MNDEVLKHAQKLVAERLSQRRKALGMSQQEVADKAGLGWATVQRIEAGHFGPDFKTLMRLCFALDLYFFVEEKEASTPLADAMKNKWGKPGEN